MLGIVGSAEPADSGVGRRWRWALFALVIAELAAGFETTLMFAALPTALKEVGRPLEVAWLITGYLLVSASAAAICGRLGDIFGRRRILLWTLAIATAGSIMSALASDLAWIIAGRAVQGLAGAILPLCYGLLRENLPTEKVPLGIGIVSAAASFSAAGGFILGGIIVDAVHWQHIFAASAVLAIAGFIACHILLPPSPGRPVEGKMDILGGLLFAPGVAMMLWAMGLLQKAGAGDPEPWAWLGGSLCLLAFWFRHERQHPHPAIDVRMLANRRILTANLAAICASLGALQILQIFPILLQQPVWTGVGFGLTATLTGLLKLPSNITSVIGASWAGALCARRDSRSIMIGGAASSLVAWALLWVDHQTLWLTVVLVCFSSAGFTALFVSVINVVMATAPDDRTSEAAAMTATLRTIAQSIGSQIIVTLFATSLIVQSGGHAFPAPAAYDMVMGYMTLASLAALAAALALPRQKLE